MPPFAYISVWILALAFSVGVWTAVIYVVIAVWPYLSWLSGWTDAALVGVGVTVTARILSRELMVRVRRWRVRRMLKDAWRR